MKISLPRKIYSMKPLFFKVPSPTQISTTYTKKPINTTGNKPAGK